MRAVVFDLDGTLVDSAGDIHASVNRMLEDQGLAGLDLVTVRGFIGHGVPRLVERVMEATSIDPRRHEELVGVFMRHYRAAPAERTATYTGVERALTALRDTGYRLGICTNKPGDLTHAVLAALGLDEHVEAVVGGDALPQRKPDPAPLHEAARQLGATSILYVGDSEVDAETAAQAGVPFVLFTEGYRDRPVAEIASAATFTCFDDLPPLIERLVREARSTAG